MSLEKRAAIANEYPLNSISRVSIHFNSAPSHDIYGFSRSFYFYGSPKQQDRRAKPSDGKVSQRGLPSRSRGVTPKDYAVLWRTNGLAVLIECGFLSNKIEANRVSTAEGEQAIAQASYKGLILRGNP